MQNDAKAAHQEQQRSRGGDQTSSKGTPGAGDEQKSQGSPKSQDGMKPTEKPEHAGSKEGEAKQQESPAGANSKRESDSHGEQGGDKAGGGLAQQVGAQRIVERVAVAHRKVSRLRDGQGPPR